MRERPKYNYHGLLDYLSRGRNKNDRPGDKASLRIQRIGGEPVVRMYRANIATFHSNGSITIDVGGWEDSMTTRANVGEVTGASIFTIAQHKKRAIEQSTRLYVSGMPSGVPYRNGCIVERGSAVWHPAMKEQNISDIRDLVEDMKVVNKEKAAPYYKARKALLKRIRPVLHFIDERVLEGIRQPHHLKEWLEDILTNPPADDELMQVACHLVDLGKPSDSGHWSRKSGFDPEKAGEYAQRGIAKCVGASSWGYLEHIGALETVKVRCMDV
jgi:hypothetical protein